MGVAPNKVLAASSDTRLTLRLRTMAGWVEILP